MVSTNSKMSNKCNSIKSFVLLSLTSWCGQNQKNTDEIVQIDRSCYKIRFKHFLLPFLISFSSNRLSNNQNIDIDFYKKHDEIWFWFFWMLILCEANKDKCNKKLKLKRFGFIISLSFIIIHIIKMCNIQSGDNHQVSCV